MCDTCSFLQLDRCPPTNAGPDPAVAEQISFEADVEEGLRGATGDRASLDATTELVLRARLDDPQPEAA